MTATRYIIISSGIISTGTFCAVTRLAGGFSCDASLLRALAALPG